MEALRCFLLSRRGQGATLVSLSQIGQPIASVRHLGNDSKQCKQDLPDIVQVSFGMKVTVPRTWRLAEI